MVPVPKDKYYDILPVLLSQSIELALNTEIRTVSGNNNSTAPPKNTYDYECKQDLFQTVYYEVVGFLPSAFFIEKIIQNYTKTENKMGINTSYFSGNNKKQQKGAPVKGVKKNLCNVISSYFLDQSRNNPNQSYLHKSIYSKNGSNAFMKNSNIAYPVSSKTLPALSLSPSRMSHLNDRSTSDFDDSEIFVPNTSRAPRFDTSTLSP